ncbi:bis-aminopropyl spermidine synthase family protein [Actinomadura decatromicini]|uniref:Putative methyltransferase n=1 Tax=Actinomadura decatromicini TaxID=2604572 RepID=A0A5D3FD87_9ACTN|nr:bis-aminopropyl spermidine synthase family protein [Actinomadura decatromicini]TYK46857.1 putative methyltransferase [Actinomadura decatromicini]
MGDEDGTLPAAGDMEPRRVHAALTLLADGSWWTLADLVRETAAPRRSVEALLASLKVERAGDRFRLTGDVGELLRYRPFTPADPVEHLLRDHAGVVERMTELITGAPRGRHVLDHVAATPDTVVRRALLLGARFWLPGARLLCVGDHDLTSLAVGLVHPEVETLVVDVDERILAYIDARAAELGLRVSTRWADLRLGLPPSAAEYADLAITDPPYTPDGVGLFVARAVQGLREQARGRVLLAYGASDRTPALALKVQNALRDLNLVSEAIYPDFNRYHGAEAIGSAADLYVLRPTAKSLPAASARADRFGAAIYTQGPQAVESRDRFAPSADDLADLRPDVLVGDWPKPVLPGVPRARLSTWLAKPYAARTREVAVALPAGMERALVRVLLAARAERARVVLAEPPDVTAVAAVLEPVFEVTADGSVVEAVRRTPDDDSARRVLRAVLERAHGKVANTWRDALIDVRPGLTKRQARALVADAAHWAHDVTPLELPLHRLRELPDAVRASLSS